MQENHRQEAHCVHRAMNLRTVELRHGNRNPSHRIESDASSVHGLPLMIRSGNARTRHTETEDRLSCVRG